MHVGHDSNYISRLVLRINPKKDISFLVSFLVNEFDYDLYTIKSSNFSLLFYSTIILKRKDCLI